MRERRCWVFDMDGTLTVAVHDFRAMRRQLGVPEDVNLLEGIARLPVERQAEAERLVEAWEWAHAEEAAAAEGVVDLLTDLAAAGACLGILTRNLRSVALRTLEVAGLQAHFPDQVVIGRLETAPKPAPDGILHLLAGWGAAPGEAVMVGDYVHDVDAGRAAGVATVLVHPRTPPPWSADVVVPSVRALHELWRAGEPLP